jgi:hypothetical protein
MRAGDLALVRGMRDSHATLEAWRRDGFSIVTAWLRWSLAVSAALLVAVWAVARVSTPDPTPLLLPGVNAPAGLDDVIRLLYRNGLVLALHALACLAGFIARSSLPDSLAARSGLSRAVHERAGPIAIAFVVAATGFSLVSQALVLGMGASTLAAQLGVGPGLLLFALVPHAGPELTALFLPLAAWLVAGRRRAWHELPAASVLTVAIAAPVLVLSAVVEVYATPGLLLSIAAR